MTSEARRGASDGAEAPLVEEYAALERGGYAYAVVLKSGATRRAHASRPLAELFDEWARGDRVYFDGASDAPVRAAQGDDEGDDDEEDGPAPVATYAFGVAASELAGLGYWTPDDEPEGELDLADLARSVTPGAPIVRRGGKGGIPL